ncbi:hypothetical protein XBI1_440012 [Xenorhabdus bovienii str. Intermedium]|uniref:Uncharacterized protein n=1 Tax=Xenorhabdus bovienii str. Intermedium TaxID=1379677 RepID=A0A077QFB2_XENBV|nr:hypothetical protein XBI1_440012 [Xenorhabdus bovienii str. Intermedium]
MPSDGIGEMSSGGIGVPADDTELPAGGIGGILLGDTGSADKFK